VIRPIADAERTAVDLPALVTGLFSEHGLLAQGQRFEYRPEQQTMAAAVARALHRQDHLAIEAGTGVGKSYAYLFPAVLHALVSRKRAVVSTHTINLQEQLLDTDIPFVQQTLRQLRDARLFAALADENGQPPAEITFRAAPGAAGAGKDNSPGL
jgi:ATP-dependent DNA helicase DinG